MSPSADILVLGANGTLGSHVVHALEQAQLGRVLAHTAPLFTGPQSLKDYLEAHRPKVVLNCIGYLGADPAEHYRINGCLPRALADWCHTRAFAVHISTNAVFAAHPDRLWKPDEPLSPSTPYETSKAFGEDPRLYVVRVSFIGQSGRGKNLWERLKAGAPYKDAPYNGVSAWRLALRLLELAKNPTPRAGLEHVHASAATRIAAVAALLGSKSPCEGEATNARLLGGGIECGPLEEQMTEYLRLEPALTTTQSRLFA